MKYSYGYTLADIVGTYDMVQTSALDGKPYTTKMVIEASDDAKKGNVMITTYEDYECTTPIYATFDMDGGTLTIPAPQDDYYYTGGIYVYSDNKLYSLATMEWHNGMKPYVYSDNQEDFDWETYNSEMKLRYMFCTYSTDGTLIDAVALEDLSDNFDTYLLPKQFYIDNGEAYITLDSGSILRINKKDGSAEEIYNLADKYKGSYGCDLQLFKDRDGKTLLFTAFHDSSSDDLSYKVSVDEFDLQSGKAGENIYTPQADLNADSEVNFVSGYGDYRFCLVNDKMVDGLDVNGLCYVVNDQNAIRFAVDELMPRRFDAHQIERRRKNMKNFYNIEEATDLLLKLIG
jgi:hypothetical protein